MEEAPISVTLGAMSSIIGKLVSLVESQHLFREPVRKGIKLLKEDLAGMNTMLQQLSNDDGDPNLTNKYWMKEVREVSYDIEDYIDKLMYSGAKIGSFGVVPRLKIRRLPSTLNRRKKVAIEIQELRARLQDAGERHERYVVQHHGTPSASAVSCYSYDDKRSIAKSHRRPLVGIDGSRGKLLKLVNDGGEELKVISVLGIGGIGKTALVRNIFEEDGGQFGFRAFVRVSRKPDTRSVLRSILSQTRCRHACDASTVQLIACLYKHLQDKRYLIVLDDLWNTTVWDILLDSFPHSTHSSRIIITTTVENVALTCCGDQSDYVLVMEPLNLDDSRKLFFRRVFGSEDEYPQHFEDASYEITRKCGGVPLAIINTAGILASQLDKQELWDYVQKSFGSGLNICPTNEGMINVINLGYNGLPHCLKTCLQYVSVYPENCAIWKDDLVRRWIAEGFVGPKEWKDMEAVAERYFEELVYRGMIQPIDVNDNDEVLSCTVHNLVHDLLVKNSTEDNFITRIDCSENMRELSNKVRRLFLFFSRAKYAAKPSGVILSQVRSLTFYGLIKCMPSILEFEFLQVLFLHFSDDCSEHTPVNLTGIRRLFQLKYLKVTCNISLNLPTHIEGLHLLETLELDAKVASFPGDVVCLHHLVHLRLPSGTNLPDEMGRMKSLRTLKCSDLGSNFEDKFRSLVELTNLEKLELICTTVPSERMDKNLKVLCSILGSFRSLKYLDLAPGYSIKGSSTSVVDSSSMSPPPVSLERFKMHSAICTFSRIPEWIRILERLFILKIAVTEFLQNDMDSLGGLPGLKVLSLNVQRPAADRIVFNSGAFSALKFFKFKCSSIFGFVFQGESMPNLQRLKLCFKAHRGQDALIRLARDVQLQNLQEIALRIGAATCAEQYHRRAAEAEFKVAIGENSRKANINIQYVSWADDDCVPEMNNIQQACHFDHEILGGKKSDGRIFGNFDMPSSSFLPSSGPHYVMAESSPTERSIGMSSWGGAHISEELLLKTRCMIIILPCL